MGFYFGDELVLDHETCYLLFGMEVIAHRGLNTRQAGYQIIICIKVKICY